MHDIEFADLNLVPRHYWSNFVREKECRTYEWIHLKTLKYDDEPFINHMDY